MVKGQLIHGYVDVVISRLSNPLPYMVLGYGNLFNVRNLLDMLTIYHIQCDRLDMLTISHRVISWIS